MTEEDKKSSSVFTQDETQSNVLYSCLQLLEQAKIVLLSDIGSDLKPKVDAVFATCEENIQQLWSESTGVSHDGKLSGESCSEESSRNSAIRRQVKHYTKASNIHVLVVDDDPIATKMLARQLRTLNFETTEVNSGSDAIALIFRFPNKFDMVLCDVNMPGLDGGQVLRSILATPQLHNLPIVMISGDDDVSRAEKLVIAGAKDYLVKPIRLSMLGGLITKLERWKSYSEQLNASRLSTFYNISQVLVLQVRVVLSSATTVGALTNASSSNDTTSMHDHAEVMSDSSDEIEVSKQLARSHPVPENLKITHLCGVAASQPMLDLLGVTNNDLENDMFDIIPYIHPQDYAALQDHVIQEMARPHNVGGQSQRLLWRWLHVNGEVVPVTGSWASIHDGHMLIESTSLLPTLRLKQEQRKRKEAEKKAQLVEQQKRVAESKLDQEIRTAQLVRSEMDTIVFGMSNFARMVTENLSVLTWRIVVDTGVIDFVSDKSCFTILGYKSQELEQTVINRLVHPDDQHLLKFITSDICRSGRLRKVHRDGTIKWLECRSFSWWDADKSIIVVTEYDISEYLNNQGTASAEQMQE